MPQHPCDRFRHRTETNTVEGEDANVFVKKRHNIHVAGLDASLKHRRQKKTTLFLSKRRLSMHVTDLRKRL